MIPRVKQIFIDKNWTVEKSIKYINKNFVAQIPVYENFEENVIGYVEINKLLLA